MRLRKLYLRCVDICRTVNVSGYPLEGTSAVEMGTVRITEVNYDRRRREEPSFRSCYHVSIHTRKVEDTLVGHGKLSVGVAWKADQGFELCQLVIVRWPPYRGRLRRGF